MSSLPGPQSCRVPLPLPGSWLPLLALELVLALGQWVAAFTQGLGGLQPSSPHSLMEQQVENLVAETTKQMIQESIIWGKLNSYSRDLLKENNWLQEITQDLKFRVDLLANRE